MKRRETSRFTEGCFRVAFRRKARRRKLLRHGWGLERRLLYTDGMDDSPPASTLPRLLETLTRIDERLERMERRLSQLEQVQQQLPNLVAVVTDTLDQRAAELQADGVDITERAGNALRLLERITDPSMARQLTSLLQLAEQAPNVIATLVDSFDQHVGALQERMDLGERTAMLARVAEHLTTPAALGTVETLIEHLPSLQQLLGSGVLGEGPIGVLGRAGQALTQAESVAPHPVGAFGLLRALSDHDVQRALGFAISFARAFGASLDPSRATHALPTSTEA